MNFKVPQFIEVEDKVFGPLTFKQFIYLAGGAGLCFILWRLLPHFLAIIFIAPVAGFAAALTFLKINQKPFIQIVEAFLNYQIASKLYVWKKEPKKIKPKKEEDIIPNTGYLPKMSESKLKDLAWSLDVLDSSTQNKELKQ
ncbi:PrgI family protein [Candidatus Nomurabacteria bacterium]|nr:PrgI family protein [Candidatus Nomurabacteria bacterium]USN94676.1 MAG: PrgI family protein [Candidatus Nomurabacteria bacterium]